MLLVSPSAYAQNANLDPFTGAARTATTFVVGKKVTLNWVYGRTSEVYISADIETSKIGAELLSTVRNVTGCVGKTVSKIGSSLDEFDALVRANCRTRWEGGGSRSIQVATFKTQKSADSLFLTLSLAGLLPTIRKSKVRGRLRYSVFTSGYRSPSEVAEVLAYLKGIGYHNTTVR
jgi:hypothetical protein